MRPERVPPTTSRALLIEPQPFYSDRGTPIAVRHVLSALSELGWHVDVLTFPIGEPVDIPNVDVTRVGNPLSFRQVKVGFSLPKLVLDGMIAADLARRLRRTRYDAVHAVEEAALIYASLAGKAGAPLIYDMASSLPEQLAQHKAFGIGPLQRGFVAAERWLLQRAACVVCSAGLSRRVRSMAPATQVREWRFPADIEIATPAAVQALRLELQLAPAAPVVVYVGNFAGYQGIDLLLDAARRVLERSPAVAFVCVGAASDAEAAAAMGSFPQPVRNRVRVLRRQSRERVGPLGLADILVSPRRYGANFPLKLFEYLAAGKAIVATDIEAHTCVLDGSLACLVPPSAEGLADGILGLLESPEREAALASAAAGYAATELSWPVFKALRRHLCHRDGTGRRLSMRRRLRILYLVPGHGLMATAGRRATC